MSQFFINANGGGGGGPIETINSQPPVGGNFNFTSPDGSITITSAPGLITLESAGGGTGTPFAIWNTNGSGVPSWMTTTTITGSYQTTGGNFQMPYTNSSGTQGAIVYGPIGNSLSVMNCDQVNNFACGPGVNTAVIAGGTHNLAFALTPFAALTTGVANLGCGHTPFTSLVSGSFNVGLGGYESVSAGVGTAYTSNESSNILLNSAGVIGDQNTLRIGTQGTDPWESNRCFIAGIVGVTTSNSEMVTIDSTTGQLGVASIPSGTVTSVSGTTNRITSTGGATPVIDISASYVGQNSITTLGTITTGTWAGTTVAINHGGTNATSYTQTNGIVVYNGTSLVNYSGPQLSSSGVYTNTSQPAFYAYASTNTANVTGDGTAATVIFDTASTNVGSGYNVLTGIFTAPSLGYYIFAVSVEVNGLTVAHTQGIMRLVGSALTISGSWLNPYIMSASGDLGMPCLTAGVQMAANDTIQVEVSVLNGTKVVGINAGVFPFATHFSGVKVA